MSSSKADEPLHGEWNIGGFRTRWMQWGSGRPDLVGIHGFAASPRTWHRIAPMVTGKGKSLLSVGLPYHNGEDPLTQPDLDLMHYTEALTATFRAMGVQHVPVMAHSFGCRILIAAAVHDPDLFPKLIMTAPGGFQPKEDWLFSVFRRQPFLFFLRREQLMKRGLLRLAPDIREEKLLLMGKVFEKLSLSYPGISPRAAGLLPLLKLYPGQTSLIMGSDDPMVPASYAPRIAAYFNNAATYTITGGGHVPMLREPEAYFRILEQILGW
ncbi:MAG: putative hydrolases or acyltransferases (alpha/beta hydrolase superfamily) [Bacteroidetes bacterium HLUCCA01]|nr:MAG: putative hydrolases or acyltransferases (alpha/beta hydrolase superfamily) [Bacteroidetes bacterium HLUCCA01]